MQQKKNIIGLRLMPALLLLPTVFFLPPALLFSNDIQRNDLFWEGAALFQEGNYAAAAQRLAGVVDKAFPSNSSGVDANAARELAATEQSLSSRYLSAAANLYSLSLIRSGRMEEGLNAYDSAYRRGMLDAEGMLNYAIAALRSKDYGTAQKLALEADSGFAGHSTTDGTPSRGSDSTSTVDATSWRSRCRYVAGLAAFGLEDWIRAAELFAEPFVLEKVSADGSFGTEFSDIDFYRRYYLGLSQFRLGRLESARLKSAWNTLEELYRSRPNHALGEASARIAVHCALQISHRENSAVWWRRGAELAQHLVDSAQNPSQRQQAVLLAAGIYRDGGQYERALELLSPYREGEDEASLSVRFLAAEILAANGRLAEAAEEYGRLGDLCRQNRLESGEISPIGDVSAYRRGEILYSMGDYLEAAQSFAAYRRNYPGGNHLDAALYFSAEGLGKIGRADQAILQHESLLSQYPDSSFAFSSMMELLDLYQAKGEYENALRHGNRLLSRFPAEATAAGVGMRMDELKLLNGGLEAGRAALLSRYRREGGTATAAGRKAGVELAARSISESEHGTGPEANFGAESMPSAGLEAEDGAEGILLRVLESLGLAIAADDGIAGRSTQEDAAKVVFSPENETATAALQGEELVAAEAVRLLGSLYRQQNRYGEAARCFLEAARLFLRAEDSASDEDAAAALYRGAESFDVAGMRSDSSAVANQLATLFPRSPWTEAARIFL